MTAWPTAVTRELSLISQAVLWVVPPPPRPMASDQHQAPLGTEDDIVAQRQAICSHLCSKLDQSGPLHGCSLHKGPWVGAIRTEVQLAQFQASRRRAINTSGMGAFRPGHFRD